MDTSIFKKLIKVIALLAVIGAICYGGFMVIQALMKKSATPGPKTIEEISNLDFNNIKRIETTKTINGRYEPSEFIRIYKENLYEPFTNELSIKKSETFRCYDADGNLMMTLIDYPVDSVIELNVGGEISLYKKYTPPAESGP